MAQISDVVPQKTAAGYPVLAAVVNNMVSPLSVPLVGAPEVRPLVRADELGFEVYRATLVFLVAKCAHALFPKAVFRVRNSIGPALWCTLEGTGCSMDEAVRRLLEALRGLVAADRPITVEPVPYGEAVELFGRLGRQDELNLLKHRNPPVVMLSRCDDFWALNEATLAPRTGVADLYDLVPFEGGLALNVPTSAEPDMLTPLPATEPYFEVFRRQSVRARVTGVETVGDLNQAILEGRFDTLVRTVEALQARELARIADRIAAHKPAVRLVLLAGPSSAGKTTTAHRLVTQLRVDGFRPLALSTDDYFVGDARNPRDAEGKLDYEHVDAVDIPRLVADLNALFAGEAVRLRKFDFVKSQGYDAATPTRLAKGGLVVLEGIHALNPRLTAGVPDDLKFRVYLNALTQLVVDSCNRISASDTRLLRRLVRDFHFRAKSPLVTFALWPNVVAGERRWIYPYQCKADAVFNSSLDYELAVLKPYAIELLRQVKPRDGAYVQARRLEDLLENVSLARADAVPGDSILRETIGGSQIDY